MFRPSVGFFISWKNITQKINSYDYGWLRDHLKIENVCTEKKDGNDLLSMKFPSYVRLFVSVYKGKNKRNYRFNDLLNGFNETSNGNIIICRCCLKRLYWVFDRKWIKWFKMYQASPLSFHFLYFYKNKKNVVIKWRKTVNSLLVSSGNNILSREIH